MKKMALIMALAALVCWLPGQALATATYSLTITDPPAGQADGVVGGSLTGFSSGNYAFNTGTETVSGFFTDGYNFCENSSVSVVFNEVGGGVSDFLTISTTSGDWDWLHGFKTNTAYFTFRSDDGTQSFTNAVNALCNIAGYINETTAGPFDVSSYFIGSGKILDSLSMTINVSSDLDPSAVPVPPSALLLGSGLLGLVGFGWRKRS